MEQLIQLNAATDKPLTNWKNAPSLKDLKQDLLDAQPVHDAQETKINEWLDNLNVTGKAKVNRKLNCHKQSRHCGGF